jgi:hypothetical protein
MLIVGQIGQDVNPYTLGTPWDVTTAVFDGVPFSVAAQEIGPSGIFFDPTGTRMFLVGTGGDEVNPYTLGTPWDVTTAVFDGVPFSVAAQDTAPTGIFFDPTGTTMLIVGGNGQDVNRYTLATPWDVTTAVFDGVPFSIAAQESAPRNIFCDPTGTRMFLVGAVGQDVNQYLVGGVVLV